MSKLVHLCKSLTSIPLFDKIIISIVVINGIIIGMETSQTLHDQYGQVFLFLNNLILGIFIVEAMMKIIAEFPRVDRYFRQGWNIFDFSIIVLSLLPTGQFATLARLVRVLRIARIISAVPELRLIIATLFRSLPGIAHIVALLGLLFYIYGVMGYYLFHQIDPQSWGNLGACLLTLFGIVTLEGWVEKMSQVLPAMPLAWIYFVSFIVVGTFTFINLFVAVVINNLSEAKKDRLKEMEDPVSKEDILRELKLTKESLIRLESMLDKHKVADHNTRTH